MTRHTPASDPHALTAARVLAGATIVITFVAIAAVLRPMASTANQSFAEDPATIPTPPTLPSKEAISLGSITGKPATGPYQGQTITLDIVAANDEPLYTATLQDGTILAELATHYELEAQIPGLDLDTLQATTIGIVDIPLD